MASRSLAVPSFFEIKESAGVQNVSEKKRICFLKRALISILNAAREPESLATQITHEPGVDDGDGAAQGHYS